MKNTQAYILVNTLDKGSVFLLTLNRELLHNMRSLIVSDKELSEVLVESYDLLKFKTINDIRDIMMREDLTRETFEEKYSIREGVIEIWVGDLDTRVIDFYYGFIQDLTTRGIEFLDIIFPGGYPPLSSIRSIRDEKALEIKKAKELREAMEAKEKMAKTKQDLQRKEEREAKRILKLKEKEERDKLRLQKRETKKALELQKKKEREVKKALFLKEREEKVKGKRKKKDINKNPAAIVSVPEVESSIEKKKRAKRPRIRAKKVNV